jgi:hypothetical protein
LARQYLLSQVESALNGTAHNLKPWFVDLVAEVGLDATLRLTEDATRQYTGVYFYEELQGLADATGLTVGVLRCIVMNVIVLKLSHLTSMAFRSNA